MKKNNNYINKEELFSEMLKYRDNKIVSRELIEMIKLIVKKYSTSAKFYSYHFKEDMVEEIISHVLEKGIKGFKFDILDRYGKHNVYSYFTKITMNKCLEIVKKYYKHLDFQDRYINKFKGDVRSSINRCRKL